MVAHELRAGGSVICLVLLHVVRTGRQHGARLTADIAPDCSASFSSPVVCCLVKQTHYRPEVPRGFQGVKVPRLRDSGPGWW